MSSVFFASLKVQEGGLLEKLEVLLDAAGAKSILGTRPFTGLKLHFGERGNTAFVRPLFVKRVANYCERHGAKPFLFDTTALYSGARANAVDHIRTAMEHGFDFGYPILIADGLLGDEKQDVAIKKKHFERASIARLIFSLDSIIAISHFKGHPLTGFGGAIKNIAMGCASKEGKLAMHSTVSPFVERSACTACGLCAGYCPAGAITIDGCACIDAAKCIGCGACIALCPDRAIRIKWDVELRTFQERLAEYCFAVTNVKQNSMMYLNFLMNITPSCDCFPQSDAPIVPDIGVLASQDPVAIDQASCDLLRQAIGLEGSKLKSAFGKGDDKWKDLYPEVDWEYGLNYAEEIGIGERRYELEEVTEET
jgi:uncharacterized Fe-S center protein